MFSIEQRDSQLLNTSASIRYHIHFDNAAQHLLRIRMEIDVQNDEDSYTLGLPVWIPGSYKVRDFSTQQGNVKLLNEHGADLPWEWTAKNRLHVQTQDAKTVVAEYVYFSWEPGIRGCNVSRNRAFINPSCCFMFVEGREQEIHHVYLHHNRSSWDVVSTPLSPISKSFRESEPMVVGALNYDILVDSPLEIGSHYSKSFNVGGSVVEVALIFNDSANFDPDWLTEQIETIVKKETDLWGETPFDRYVFMIQLLSHARSGLEHTRCSVNGISPDLVNDQQKTIQLLSLLCHEFFHTWNVKRIRPRELGPFNYNDTHYTRMLWLAEGLTSYYDDLLTYRCGFYSQEEYVASLGSNQLTMYRHVQGRLQMSIKDSSYLAWNKLYMPTPDTANRVPSYYLKGGIIFLMLDLHIIGESKGAKSFDDCLRALWKSYKDRPELGITEDEFIEIVEESTGITIRDMFLHWLNSTDELPLNDMLEHVGLQFAPLPNLPKKSTYGRNKTFMADTPRVFVGVRLKEEHGKVTVQSVEDFSPAYEAGLGADDEILAVNGTRVRSAQEFSLMLAKVGTTKSSEVLIACDDRLSTVQITPAEHNDYALQDVENVTPLQIRLRDEWLKIS